MGPMALDWYIYLHENRKTQPNVGKDLLYMDGMGYLHVEHLTNEHQKMGLCK